MPEFVAVLTARQRTVAYQSGGWWRVRPSRPGRLERAHVSPRMATAAPPPANGRRGQEPPGAPAAGEATNDGPIERRA